MSFLKRPSFWGYGLDFGFTKDPTALVGLYRMDGAYIYHQLLCQKGMTNSEIAHRMKSLGVGRSDVVVVYAYEGGATVTDILKHCRILSVKKEMKVDDEFMEVELPLAVGQIQYNV